MNLVLYQTLIAAFCLAIVHVLTPSLRFLNGTPRSAWLSVAGGVAVAYVFVHFLPELASGETDVGRVVSAGPAFAERHVYLIALCGLVTFYGLDRMAKLSRLRRQQPLLSDAPAERADAAATGPWVFRIHIASFAAYNGLVGYLLSHREVMTSLSLTFFSVAMALHFVVTDYGLNEDHKAPYRTIGRWVLIVALLGGWALGVGTPVSKAAIAALTAFLGGGVILNVLKDEVPGERESRFWPFLAGAGCYSTLLLTV